MYACSCRNGVRRGVFDFRYHHRNFNDYQRQRKQTIPSVWDYGGRAGRGGFLSSCAAGVGALYEWIGKLYGGVGRRKIYHVYHDDGVLRAVILRMADSVSNRRAVGNYHFRLRIGSFAYRLLFMPQQRMVERKPASFMGDLSQYPVCIIGDIDYRIVLCKRA